MHMYVYCIYVSECMCSLLYIYVNVFEWFCTVEYCEETTKVYLFPVIHDVSMYLSVYSLLFMNLYQFILSVCILCYTSVKYNSMYLLMIMHSYQFIKCTNVSCYSFCINIFKCIYNLL